MVWLRVIFWMALAGAVAAAEDYANNESVNLFRQYVQINTTTHGDLSPAVEFWRNLADSEGLEFNVYEFDAGYPVAVIRWPGDNSSLTSIMLNSHMDVVPAVESEGWTYPPFSAFLDEEGVIWGRGTQDMKSVGIQYFEAMKRIKANGVILKRDIYMTLMPDEETGAEHGMERFLASDEFKAMNVGFEMDEGTPFDLPVIPMFYQDKIPWEVRVDCYGIAGHGSTFPEANDTAVGKCRNVMNTFLDFRQREYEKSLNASITDAGTYTSLNMNMLNGGTAFNVLPSSVSLTFDIRLATTLNETSFEAQIEEWVKAAGDNITVTYVLKGQQSPATIVDASNPYFVAALSVANNLNLTILPVVPPGATDARFIRSAGIPAFGFSPMPGTELLLHAVNERLAASTFLNGIDIYEQLITAVANLPATAISPDPSTYIVYTATSSI